MGPPLRILVVDMSNPASKFLACLPAGEWSDVEIIADPGGMMAERADAIHATAVWIREDTDAYLKCILGRGESAGVDTRRYVGMQRLARVRDRLTDATQDEKLPTARLIETRLLDALPGLLVAMERVEPLHGILKAGKLSKELSINVLDTLGSERCGKWIHYDICPKNTGITRSDDCVFIDPESLYRADEIHVDVSLPAFKPNRTLHELAMNCARGAFDGTLSVELARKKHDAELIVLGAECCLGLFGFDFDEAAAERWCAEADCEEGLRQFWRTVLVQMAQGDVPSPSEVALKLRRLRLNEPVAGTSATVPKPPAESSGERIDFDSMYEWDDMEEVRRSLRRDLFDRSRIIQYRKRLQALAETHPSDRAWWRELLLVSLAYERDPLLAEQVADQALTHFEGDVEFIRKRQLARMWSHGRQ